MVYHNAYTQTGPLKRQIKYGRLLTRDTQTTDELANVRNFIWLKLLKISNGISIIRHQPLDLFRTFQRNKKQMIDWKCLIVWLQRFNVLTGCFGGNDLLKIYRSIAGILKITKNRTQRGRLFTIKHWISWYVCGYCQISRSREGCNDESKEQCSNATPIDSVEIDSPRTRKEFELIESKIHHWKENKVRLKEHKFKMLKSTVKTELMNQY